RRLSGQHPRRAEQRADVRPRSGTRNLELGATARPVRADGVGLVVHARGFPMTTHRGGCHCGAVRFEADGEIAGVELCNCSICTRTGYLHWYVAPERFRLLTPREAFDTYVFGTRVAQHHFCKTCGISPFRRARSNPDEVDVNVRCVEGVDL